MYFAFKLHIEFVEMRAILKFQTLNAQLHITGIISVKFHYNWIKKIFSNFHGYHGNGSHFENVKPRSTSTQPMDLSCEVPLLSNKKKKNPEEKKKIS